MPAWQVDRRLFWAIGASAVLHAVILSGRNFVGFGEAARHQEAIRAEVVLRSAKQVAAPEGRPLAAPQRVRQERREATVMASSPLARAPTAHPEASASVTSSAVASTQQASIGAEQLPVVTSGPSKEGLRDYRIALGRAAQRLREEYEGRYNALERERRRGWEGRVEMNLQASAAGGLPALSLARSSGHSELDTQALELLGRAVQVTAIPAILRGQAFSMSLVMDFRLRDD